jgi:hypothetical protein
MKFGVKKNSESLLTNQSELNTNLFLENNNMTSPALRRIRIVCAVIFVLGIAGMIISSIAGNNVGIVTTIGATTAVTAIVLLIATVAASTAQLEVFNEAQAQRLERKISALVKSGTDETSLRSVVRDASKLGRRT